MELTIENAFQTYEREKQSQLGAVGAAAAAKTKLDQALQVKADADATLNTQTEMYLAALDRLANAIAEERKGLFSRVPAPVSAQTA